MSKIQEQLVEDRMTALQMLETAMMELGTTDIANTMLVIDRNKALAVSDVIEGLDYLSQEDSDGQMFFDFDTETPSEMM